MHAGGRLHPVDRRVSVFQAPDGNPAVGYYSEASTAKWSVQYMEVPEPGLAVSACPKRRGNAEAAEVGSIFAANQLITGG